MQQRPDLTQLLSAVAAFLTGDLAPATADRALRFRVLIAANLVRQVGAELAAGDRLVADEVASAAAVLGREAPPPSRAALADLDRELARRIRAGELDADAVRDHLLAAYAAYLGATDGKFDLSREIE